jgi:hypothetical protein
MLRPLEVSFSEDEIVLFPANWLLAISQDMSELSRAPITNLILQVPELRANFSKVLTEVPSNVNKISTKVQQSFNTTSTYVQHIATKIQHGCNIFQHLFTICST